MNSPIYTRYDEREAVKSSYLQAYNSLRGFGGVPNVAPFGLLDYYCGKVLYRFLSEDHDSMIGSSAEVVPLKRSGNLRVTLQFDKALSSPKTVVMFGTFASGFKVDTYRRVSTV